jgi:chorismate mutase-like protein
LRFASRNTILAQDDSLNKEQAIGANRNFMNIADWRKKIDEVDRRLVELLSERARSAVEIGRLKRDTNLPIYEPERERVVFENVKEMNRGPLPGPDLVRIFERIMDVMRNIQKEGIGTKAKADENSTATELDSELND